MTYQLLIQLESNETIRVGKLGKIILPAGYYIYTGSAKLNFPARIHRHIKKYKKKKWHIDFLLNRGKIIQIKRYLHTKECKINIQTLNKIKGTQLVKKFGSSDCNCYSHLIYTGKKFELIN